MRCTVRCSSKTTTRAPTGSPSGGSSGPSPACWSPFASPHSCCQEHSLLDDISFFQSELELTDLQKSIDRILDSYKSAVLARDVEAFMRLYDPEVRVFDAWGIWLYAGAAAWQTAVEGWFTSLGTERVHVRFDEVQSSSDRDMATVSAIVT